MAQRLVYVQVKVEITNDKVDEITDEMIDDIVCNVDYQFNNVGDFELETEIVETYVG